MEPTQGNNVNNDLPVQVGNVDEVQGPIQKLPPEILKVIFSQLENLDPQQIGVVSKLWNVEVLNAVKDEEFKLLDSFVNALINTLEFIAKNPDDYDGFKLDEDDLEDLIEYCPQNKSGEAERAKQIEVVASGLTKTLKNTKITQPFDLFKIKSSLMDVKNEIINLLTGLDLDIIYILSIILKNEKLPETWKLEVFPMYGQHKDDIFGLASCLTRARRNSDFEYTFDRRIVNACKGLVGLGYMDRAIEMAGRITNKVYRSEFFEYISRELVNHSYFDKAIKVIVENPITNDTLIAKIIRDLANAGKVDLALTVCNSIKDAKKKDYGLSHVTSLVLQRGDYEGAIKICALIEDDQLRSSAKNKIIQQVTNDVEYLKTNPDLLLNLQKS